MSTVTNTAAATRSSRRPTVIVGEIIRLPEWVDDLDSFRRWARSDDFPTSGWVSYLNDEIWADTSMEQLFSHNQVKTEFTVAVGGLVKAAAVGYYFSDRALLSHVGANISTEPDGLFVSYDSIRKGQIRLVEGAHDGFTELEGTPDMVFEVISRHSVRKDTEILPELYWKAGIPEFWRVDARGETVVFEILRKTTTAYEATPAVDGWVPSSVFGREFQFLRQDDLLGHPRFVLNVRTPVPSTT